MLPSWQPRVPWTLLTATAGCDTEITIMIATRMLIGMAIEAVPHTARGDAVTTAAVATAGPAMLAVVVGHVLAARVVAVAAGHL